MYSISLQPRQQLVEPVDEADRVLQLLAQAEHRLIVEDEGPVAELLLIGLVLQLEHNRMMRIDLQNRLCRGQGLSGRL